MTDHVGETCWACEKGRMLPRVSKNTVEYKGQTTELDLHHSVCDVCGIDLAGGEQVNQNAKLMTIFCKKVDGLLSGPEVKAIRERLSLNEEEASIVFEDGSISFSEYENDRETQSEETDRILRLAAANPEAFMQARNMAMPPIPA